MILRLRDRQGGILDKQFSLCRVRIGRDPKCELTLDGELYPGVSGTHAEVVVRNGQVWLVHRSKTNPTLMGGNPIHAAVRILHGERFQLGFTGPEIEYVGTGPAESQDAAQTQSHSIRVDETPWGDTARGEEMPYARARSTRLEFLLGQGGVLGRESCDFPLHHPHVSRRHCRIRKDSQRTMIADLGSSSGTFLNGRRISVPEPLLPGSTLDIGPFSFLYDGEKLTGQSRANNVRLQVSQLCSDVPDTGGKGTRRLLHDVSFTVEPGEFMAVLGPSGSGKTTLLRTISGRTWPHTGQVLVNHIDLHRCFRIVREDLVVVPQSSAMHQTLTVAETLCFTAALKLPADVSEEESQLRIQDVLFQTGLSSLKENRICQLSGGQLKRLSLACELISDPSLLFLDEVTSGLDELADREIMQLLRNLADRGKTLICITHNAGNVRSLCHRVLILATGGHAAYCGPPVSACQYFHVSQLGDIYERLKMRSPETWGSAYRSRQRHPQMNPDDPRNPAESGTGSVLRERVKNRFWSQTAILNRRAAAVWRGDKPALLAIGGQTLLVTLLIGLVFRSIPSEDNPVEHLARITELRSLLFLTGVSCFWLGANNSSREIVRERAIFQRERDFNLSPEAFLASKLSVLSLMGFLQCLCLVLVVFCWCSVPVNLFHLSAICLSLSWLGTCLGLSVSAISRTEVFATALVPAVVIPQIILAGVVSRLEGATLSIAKLAITCFWGQKCLESALTNTDRIPSDFVPAVPECLVFMAIHGFVFLAVSWLGVRFVRTQSG